LRPTAAVVVVGSLPPASLQRVGTGMHRIARCSARMAREAAVTLDARRAAVARPPPSRRSAWPGMPATARAERRRRAAGC
jgi:hypothetical protein